MNSENCVVQPWRWLEPFEVLPFSSRDIDGKNVGIGLFN